MKQLTNQELDKLAMRTVSRETRISWSKNPIAKDEFMQRVKRWIFIHSTPISANTLAFWRRYPDQANHLIDDQLANPNRAM